jgi:hypothetical protein
MEQEEYYMSEEQAKQIYQEFGWCGCGNVDEALEVLRQVLELFDNYGKDLLTYEERQEEFLRFCPILWNMEVA